jgi:hypothetical protein
MDMTLALALCLLVPPVISLIGWLIVENHDRFHFQIHRPERRGFEVLPPRRALRGGYSFTEVMFAVVVLGIGFVMVAAMFPVALSQQALTVSETSASAIARSAIATLTRIGANSPNTLPAPPAPMPPTDGTAPTEAAPLRPFTAVQTGLALSPLHTGDWNAVRGSVVQASEPRMGFVPLYRRETGEAKAQVWVIVTQARNRPRYDNTDTAVPATTGTGNLQPRPIEVTITNGASGAVDTMLVKDATGADAIAGAKNAVGEGAYIIIADDPAVGTKPRGRFNGYIYRVGAQSTDANGDLISDRWDLAPGADYSPRVSGSVTENGIAGTYTGPVQDVAVYTSFMAVSR